MDVIHNTSNKVEQQVERLLPKKLAARRRWKKQASRESLGSAVSGEGHSQSQSRGRSPHSREPHEYGDDQRSIESNDADTLSQSRSRENLDEENVLETLEEYSLDSRSPHRDRRPTVPSTHPSQIGHLTTSSPLIQAAHAPEVQSLDTLATETTSDNTFSRSATYSVSVSSDSPSTEPIRKLSVSKTGLQPPQDQTSRRSRSPAGRIKNVFRSKRNSSATPSFDSQTSDKTDRSNSGSLDPGASAESLHESIVAPSPQKPPRRTGRGSDASLVPPRTPPSAEPAAPVIVNTPPTPPLGNDQSRKERARSRANSIERPHTSSNIPYAGLSTHRRMRSGSGTSIGPSKLSNITLAPLTPTPENGPLTPGGGGFFSSMLSAAQNAATTLSSTVTNTNISIGNNRPKTPIPAESQEGDGDTTEVESSADQTGEIKMGEPAVKTLGMGDLSLDQLGIQESSSGAPTPQVSKFPEHLSESRTRSESAPAEPASLSLEDPNSRPRSLNESAVMSDRSPPTSLFEGKAGIQRSSSIRSAIGRRRKRGSTGGTANTSGTTTTIGAAIAAANASVAHPNAAGSTPKLTGFAVASKKRNRDFHNLFKSVPDDDYLIEDYSCAIQREILAHGRLYVSEGHLCFSSNIFGWVTTLVMSFDEIVSVEKRSTALLFKNGLMISTLHAKHVFASFTSRDSTYDLIVNIWKLGHPTLKSSLNGVSIDETGGDKTEKIDDMDASAYQSGSGSDVMDGDDGGSDSGEDVYDEDEEDAENNEVTQPTEPSPTDTDAEKTGGRKVSGALGASVPSAKTQDGAAATPGGDDFPGPASHAPTDCGDSAAHYERPLADEVIAAPLGKVYNLIFGPASVKFMQNWLTGEQKCTDFQGEDKIGLTQDNKTRGYSYIKPLNASIGPKQTKCITTETLEQLDLEKSVNVLCVTQNPDVPSGNVFSVKTKYCLSWAENNSTRVQVTCTIEWTGKSWLKGPIEKGANDGQIQYCKDLTAVVRAAVTTQPRSAIANNGPGGKGKKKGRKGKPTEASKESQGGVSSSAAAKTPDWGLFEPLRGILGPVVDIIKPILTGNVVYGLLVGLLVASWFGFGFNPRQAGPGYGHGLGFANHADRIVAYEEIWRREESDLWDWLEERVGLHRMNEGAMPIRKRVVEPRSVEEKIREDRMNDREVEEAIRVTEEKLEMLKQVHWKKRSPNTGRPAAAAANGGASKEEKTGKATQKPAVI
ncbi:hypothetical protein PG990_009606 [Apiospora arundinis]|uniref:VASt domain-containing protein n=1 Tax=Apiospora arundinis TaxID=335852 RepID=A0ABR2ITT5_9PEZI